MTAPFRPLGDRVLLRRIPEADVSRGGIIIPASAKERPMTGKVVAVGPGKRLESGAFVETVVKKDDVVLFGKFSGHEIKDPENEMEVLVVMSEADILGVVEAECDTSSKA